MAHQVRVSPDQLRERANQYRGQAEKLEEVVAQLDNLLSQLRGEWEGAASDAFAARHEEFRADFKQVVELAHQISTALDSTALAFEEMDQQLARELGSFSRRYMAYGDMNIQPIYATYRSVGGK